MNGDSPDVLIEFIKKNNYEFVKHEGKKKPELLNIAADLASYQLICKKLSGKGDFRIGK